MRIIPIIALVPGLAAAEIVVEQSIVNPGPASVSCNQYTNPSASAGEVEVETWTFTIDPETAYNIAGRFEHADVDTGGMSTFIDEWAGDGGSATATATPTMTISLDGQQLGGGQPTGCIVDDKSYAQVSWVETLCTFDGPTVSRTAIREALRQRADFCDDAVLEVRGTINKAASCATGHAPARATASGELFEPSIELSPGVPPTACAPGQVDGCYRFSMPTSWSDFAGTIPPELEAHADAGIMLVFLPPYNLACAPDGSILYDGGLAGFRPDLSFSRCPNFDSDGDGTISPDEIADCEQLFRHERSHYRIREVEACLLRNTLAAASCADRCVQGVVRDITTTVAALRADVEASYETQTANGTDTAEQAAWDAQIDDWILSECGQAP